MYLYDSLLFRRNYSIYLKYINAKPHHYNWCSNYKFCFWKYFNKLYNIVDWLVLFVIVTKLPICKYLKMKLFWSSLKIQMQLWNLLKTPKGSSHSCRWQRVCLLTCEDIVFLIQSWHSREHKNTHKNSSHLPDLIIATMRFKGLGLKSNKV